MPIEPATEVVDRKHLLAGLGLSADARVILYVFDGSSYLVRKNPAALVRAFEQSDLAAEGWMFWDDPQRWTIWATGKSILGALLGGYAGVEVAKKWTKYTEPTGDWFALIAPLGILHFWWMKAAKHDFGQPILFGVIVAVLLGMRLYWKREKSLAARPRPATVS